MRIGPPGNSVTNPVSHLGGFFIKIGPPGNSLTNPVSFIKIGPPGNSLTKPVSLLGCLSILIPFRRKSSFVFYQRIYVIVFFFSVNLNSQFFFLLDSSVFLLRVVPDSGGTGYRCYICICTLNAGEIFVSKFDYYFYFRLQLLL